MQSSRVTAAELDGEGGLLGCVVDRVSYLFDAVATRPRRKLVALAMCHVLRLSGAPAEGGACGYGALRHGRMAGILGCCSDVISDGSSDNDDDRVVHVTDLPPGSSILTDKWKRYHDDDVRSLRKVDLRAALHSALSSAAALGGATFQKAAASVDPALLGVN
jgi:hypothetical protein